MELVGGYCDEEFRIYEDMVTIFKVTEKGIKVHYLNKATVDYRIHRDSISRCMKAEMLRENEALEIFRKYRRRNLSILIPPSTCRSVTRAGCSLSIRGGLRVGKETLFYENSAFSTGM